MNEPEAVRRVLEVLPFVALISAYGLDQMWSAVRLRAVRLAFVSIWVVTIYLAAVYRSDLPLSQAFFQQPVCCSQSSLCSLPLRNLL